MSGEDQGIGNANISVLHKVVSIVSAYVSHNSLRAADLPELISSVHASIQSLTAGPVPTETKTPESPAISIKKSVTKDYIVCLEDGKKFKSLRRHLSSFHNLTPDEYRAKWNLPSDYPMVAPTYSATRSQLAKDSGLGQIARGDDEIDGDEVLDDGEAPTVNGFDAGEAGAHDEVVEAAAEVEEEPQPDPPPPAEAPPKKPGRGRPRKTSS